MVNAIAVRKDRELEIRCGICGKLLFVVQENSKNDVDLSSLNVIMVARCTRSSCKTDNQIALLHILNTF